MVLKSFIINFFVLAGDLFLIWLVMGKIMNFILFVLLESKLKEEVGFGLQESKLLLMENLKILKRKVKTKDPNFTKEDELVLKGFLKDTKKLKEEIKNNLGYYTSFFKFGLSDLARIMVGVLFIVLINLFAVKFVFVLLNKIFGGLEPFIEAINHFIFFFPYAGLIYLIVVFLIYLSFSNIKNKQVNLVFTYFSNNFRKELLKKIKELELYEKELIKVMNEYLELLGKKEKVKTRR